MIVKPATALAGRRHCLVRAWARAGGHGLALLASLVQATSVLAAPVAPSPAPAPLTTPAYATPLQPEGQEERGLWMQMDEAERKMRSAPQVVRDPALNDYVRGVLCRTVGEQGCRGLRLYIVRNAAFNASMAPNGMLQINTGLLLRLMNEAQLAAVLGHEFTHYEHRHSLLMYHEVRNKSSAMLWLTLTGVGMIAAMGMAGSINAYSRDQEREADIGGVARMREAGYSIAEAARTWSLVHDEMEAQAAARNRKPRNENSMWASHPPSAERMTYIAAEAQRQPAGATVGADPYRAAMSAWWPQFVDDQIKLNDFGGSDFLLTKLAEERGWTAALLYARAELYRSHTPEDLARSVGFYDQAIGEGGTLPELWRGRGLARIKLGQRDQGQADLKTYLERAPGAPDRAMMAMLAGVNP